MTFFVDEYQRQIDDSGRMILPSKLRKETGDTLYITQSPSEKCLHIYTAEGWAEIANKVKLLPTTTDPKAAAFVRMFFGKASMVNADKQGRVAIKASLLQYAGIEKDVMLVGANTRLELWDCETYAKYLDSLSQTILTEGIAKYGLGI